MTDKAPEKEAEAFVSEEKGVADVKAALDGAKDILAEHISDEADYRIYIRKLTAQKGTVVSSARKPEESSVYEMYYEFEEPVKKLAGHRVLALNRGEKEKILTVKINAPEEEILGWLTRQVIKKDNPKTTPVLKEVVEDSYKRLIAPAIEREIRSELQKKQKTEPFMYLEKIWSSFLCSLRSWARWFWDGILPSVPDVAGSSGRYGKGPGYNSDLSYSSYF